MNTTECPSKLPIRLGMFLMIICAPIIFILGFGANKKHQMKPQTAAVTLIKSKSSAEVPAKKGKTTFIYADDFTVYRSDAVYKVEDMDGKEIPVNILRNQKPIRYEGQSFGQFSAIASFIPTADSVRVYCDLISDTRGEFLVGAEMTPPSISILMILFFIVGIAVMGTGLTITFNNILVRTKWNEQQEIHWRPEDWLKYF